MKNLGLNGMKNYRVTFIKKGNKEKDEKDSVLGTINIDDNGVNNRFTLAAKAYRSCTDVMLLADKLVFQRI